ncbi:MAG: hypothetical protein ACTSRE_06750 [Promethearchaeota archaeon]
MNSQEILLEKNWKHFSEIQLLAVRPYLTVGRIEIIEKIKL